MNAVGIDVSKGKSMAAAVRPMNEAALTPREFSHTTAGLEQLVDAIKQLGGDTRVIMEATGRYHDPVAAALHAAGIFVSVVNPLLIHQFGNNSIRKVKTDKKDSLKIARYGLTNWAELRQYTEVDECRQQLKLFSRQYNLYMKILTGLVNNLIALLDKTFPGVNRLFTSPARADGHQKRIDFAIEFPHCDCVRSMSAEEFTQHYREWAKRCKYHFSAEKAAEIYAFALGLFTTLPLTDSSKLLITAAAAQVTAMSAAIAPVKAEMIRLATELPEYSTLLEFYGVGEITASQLMAEIGGVRRFNSRGALIAFAGVDPSPNQSGTYEAKSTKSSKRGSPHLRKALFQVVSTHLKKSPANEPVYQFLSRKRAEGKPYMVYMTAASNKFLRIYYAKVKACLEAPEQPKSER